MNDDELRDALLGSVPEPGPGYWDAIDARLDVTASSNVDQRAEQLEALEEKPENRETDQTVIRLTDMNKSTNPPIGPRILAIAAGLVVVAALGIGAFSLINNNDDLDVATGETLDDQQVDDGATGSTVTSSPELTVPAEFPLSMPESLFGVWRINDGAPLAEDACTQSIAENMGQIATIDADSFIYFEEGGRLIEVHERTETRIDATFDTTDAEPNQSRMVFELQDDGSLTIEPRDETFFTATISHIRCDG